LSQEQVPSLHIQHLPNRLRFTLQQKIAWAAHRGISKTEVQTKRQELQEDRIVKQETGASGRGDTKEKMRRLEH
jgi:hypothetical protein